MSDDPREDQSGSRLDELPRYEQTAMIVLPTGEVVEQRHPSKAISMAFWCLSSF